MRLVAQHPLVLSLSSLLLVREGSSTATLHDLCIH